MKTTTPPQLDITKPILTNDLKKGHKVTLRNGWEAEIFDNAKGNTRMANVHGFCTEIGSVYSHDIATVHQDGKAYRLTYTAPQEKLRTQLEGMGW